MPENCPVWFLAPRLRKPLNRPAGFKGLNYSYFVAQMALKTFGLFWPLIDNHWNWWIPIILIKFVYLLHISNNASFSKFIMCSDLRFCVFPCTTKSNSIIFDTCKMQYVIQAKGITVWHLKPTCDPKPSLSLCYTILILCLTHKLSSISRHDFSQL